MISPSFFCFLSNSALKLNHIEDKIWLNGNIFEWSVIMPVGWVIDEWRAEKTGSKWIPRCVCGNTKAGRGVHAYQIGNDLKSEQLLETLVVLFNGFS